MLVKGTVVSSIDRFVKDNFPNQYSSWLNKLPEESKELFNSSIMATEWYEIEEGVIKPTKIIGNMFYEYNAKKAAWELMYLKKQLM